MVQQLALHYDDDGGGDGDDGDDDEAVLRRNCFVQEWPFEVRLHRLYDDGDADGGDGGYT